MHLIDDESEHARKVRAREATELKACDERERELRAKIVAERLLGSVEAARLLGSVCTAHFS